jgi:hypothetical protein
MLCPNVPALLFIYSQGNIPSNDDLVQGIEKLRTSDVVDNTSKSMSPAGQQVMQNVNQVLDTSKQVIQEKNSDQELQTIIQDSIHSGRGATGKHGIHA